MKEKEKEFAGIVKAHKNTIYTVCYLFSKDQYEVNDSRSCIRSSISHAESVCFLARRMRRNRRFDEVNYMKREATQNYCPAGSAFSAISA